jgi:hypothetical protein
MRALESGAEDILTESQSEVPLDTGDLMRSGRVERSGTREVLIRYVSPYALKQHEELSYSHGGGRKWKYLEDPLRRRGKQVIKEVAEAVRLVVRG